MAGRRDMAEVKKKDGPTVAVLTGSRQTGKLPLRHDP